MRVGINGFGRIGRAVFRVNLKNRHFTVPIINEINPDINNIAYLLNYDSTYGSLQDVFTATDGHLQNSSCHTAVSHERHIDDIDWNKHGVDYVIDASGVKENLLRAHDVLRKNDSVKKVFVTHSPDEIDFTMILGVNEGELNIARHNVISTSICDATAIAPVLGLISEHFDIAGGTITTLHPMLSYQNVLDGESSSWFNPGMIYSHYPLGRSVLDNIIPKPTTAVDATFKVLTRSKIPPIASFSYRVPTTIVGSADITLFLVDKTDVSEVSRIFFDYEKKQQYKIIHNSEIPLVSSDYKMSPYSAIVDHRWLDVTGGRTLKIILWYDNEWGYASRVIDQVMLVDNLIQML